MIKNGIKLFMCSVKIKMKPQKMHITDDSVHKAKDKLLNRIIQIIP